MLHAEEGLDLFMKCLLKPNLCKVLNVSLVLDQLKTIGTKMGYPIELLISVVVKMNDQITFFFYLYFFISQNKNKLTLIKQRLQKC